VGKKRKNGQYQVVNKKRRGKGEKGVSGGKTGKRRRKGGKNVLIT
jgi:hypothetical protein